MGLNNSKTIADSPSVVNSKNIPKYTTYLILILVFEKYYFTQVFNRAQSTALLLRTGYHSGFTHYQISTSSSDLRPVFD